MTKPKNKAADSKVFDVSKPGEATPNASSRPIIVNRTQLVQDPMMKDQDKGEVLGPPTVDDNNEEFKKVIHPTATRIEIKPTSENKSAKEQPSEDKQEEPTKGDQEATTANLEPTDVQEKALDVDKETPQKVESDEETPQKAEQPEPQPVDEEQSSDKEDESKDSNPDEKQTGSEAGTDEKVADTDDNKDEKKQADSEATSDEDDNGAIVESPQPDSIVDELAKQAVSKKQKEKEDKQAAAKTEKVQKLIDDKTYFLPVGRVTRRRNARRFLLLMILLILAVVVAADLAVDAGIVKTDIKPVTHLFNN